MISTAFASNCTFMIPVGTAPNPVVYGSDKIGVRDMATEGVRINVIAIPIIIGIMWLYQAL